MPDRILFVDDEETIRELFREYLSEDGFLVKTASSGKEAMDMLKGEGFNLFLIDLVMPEMDGLELLEEIRKSGIDTPAILLTAYDLDLDESRKSGLKILGLISKGIPMSEVTGKVKQFMGG